MFFLGDKVLVNENKLRMHDPEIDIDDEPHEILDFEFHWGSGFKLYKLKDYDENFFIEDELILVERFDG